MSMEALISTFRDQVANLDLSAENASIDVFEADIAMMERAIRKANARQSEILNELAATSDTFWESGYRRTDGASVANALLAGSSTAAAAAAQPTQQDLQRERAALNLAVTDIQKRIDAVRREIADVQAGTTARVQVLVEPLVAALQAQAIEAGRTFVAAAAGLKAITYATGSGVRELIPIGHVIAKGRAGGMAEIGWGGDVAVPDDVREALRTLADKGPALNPQLIRSTRFQ